MRRQPASHTDVLRLKLGRGWVGVNQFLSRANLLAKLPKVKMACGIAEPYSALPYSKAPRMPAL